MRGTMPRSVDELVAPGVGIGFGPDTLAEARNRGYTLARPGPGASCARPRLGRGAVTWR